MLRATATKSLRSVTAARLASAPRRFASTESHHEEHKSDSQTADEGFTSPVWKYTLGAIAGLYVVSKYDDYVEKSGRVHPITKLIASSMPDPVANKQTFKEYQQDVAKRAEFNILQWEEKAQEVSSMDTVIYQKRQATWGTPVGTKVDMSAVGHRTNIRE
ncbi:hypothetical protein FBU59_004242 [Linderina macrospora]|uniref:Uncharacterized protein n=1 Tax=Linderina macrospora TaxID=4868 RepID=A0ACC1J681_9FUNG|nr:hypothetical protein FBU59_004242 [Linderina macrospora]